jgi:hypothetical protein
MKKIYKYIIVYFLLLLISCSGGGGSSEDTSYQYHTPEEVNIFLEEIAANYSEFVKLENVGTSGSGRMIKALVISDNPGTLEGEPAVRLTGGIHGNEMMSVELLIRFIEYLTYNYNKISTVTKLIDNRYICIIPVLNPDGLANKSRYNKNRVDLNRNFNDADNHWTSDSRSRSGSSPFSESESRALRDFSIPLNFTLSITYHTGAVLVNLPFDFATESEQLPEDYELIKSYAKTYTNAGGGIFLTNPDLYVSPYMSSDGWINGGNWYVATGTLQDWSYTKTGCLDLTIEISRRSPTTEEGVQQVFMYNRDSIVAYIGRAGEDVFTGK